jgi:hypothetical protein
MFNTLYKYGIGDTVTFETTGYEAARWMDYQPIKITGKIVGVENYFINATPIYRVMQINGKVWSVNQNEIIRKARKP